MGEQWEPTMSEIWRPEETKVLREDKGNILCLAAADAIERRDVAVAGLEAEIKRLAFELNFLTKPWPPSNEGEVCEHERRYSLVRHGEDGYFDDCQICRAEKAEATIAEKDAEIERLNVLLKTSAEKREDLRRSVHKEFKRAEKAEAANADLLDKERAEKAAPTLAELTAEQGVKTLTEAALRNMVGSMPDFPDADELRAVTRDAEIERLTKERDVAIHARISAQRDTTCIQNLLEEAQAEIARLRELAVFEMDDDLGVEYHYKNLAEANAGLVATMKVSAAERDADIGRLKENLAEAEALIAHIRIERDRLQEGNMRLCIIINDNTPPEARVCTVDLLEQGVEWLCGELRRVLAVAREFKAELAEGAGDGGE